MERGWPLCSLGVLRELGVNGDPADKGNAPGGLTRERLVDVLAPVLLV